MEEEGNAEEEEKPKTAFSLSNDENKKTQIEDITASLSKEKCIPSRNEEWEKRKEKLRKQAQILEAEN